MYSISLSTDRLRHLLQEIDENNLDYHLHPARDVPGPGGGVYITAQTQLNAKVLDWIENRNPSPESTTYLDVVFVHEGQEPPRPGTKTERGLPPGLAPTEDDEPAQENKEKVEKRAETASKKVISTAKEVAADAERVYRNIGTPDFSVSDLDKPDVQASMREFERGFRNFRGAVKKALDEYLNGNTLVMDLILKFQLDKPTVQHALSVAAFATEMTTLLAMKEGEGDEAQRRPTSATCRTRTCWSCWGRTLMRSINSRRKKCTNGATSCSATSWSKSSWADSCTTVACGRSPSTSRKATR